MGNIAGSRAAFVGRQDGLDLALATLDAVRKSQPRILLIEGEPGIGKTAFVRQFLARAGDVVVLEASGEESETGLEYGVVAQLVSQMPPDPSWASPGERLSRGSPANNFALGGELLAMLGSVQDQAPAVLVLDDAHWMDSASVGTLLFALRRLHGERVLALIVSRPGVLDRSDVAWSRLVSDPDRAVRLRLDGLDSGEIAELADALGHPSLSLAGAERLRIHTNGNPLYIKGLLTELAPEALASDREQLPAPHFFAATVLARLTGVTADTQELVMAASVAGRCPTGLVGAVAGLSDPSAALDEALAADLLTVVPSALPEEIAFPHPLVRAAVYDDLSPARRRRLHLAFAKCTSGPGSLGHRVAASQGTDDALAAELQRTAETDVASGNLPAATQHLLWASRVASTEHQRETALLRAVECLVWAGDGPAAHARRDEVLACRDSPRRAFVIAALTALAGWLPEAETQLRAVIGPSDFADESSLLGSITAMLAVVCAYQGKAEEAVDWARRALDAPDRRQPIEASATQALAMALMRAGHAQESVSVLAGVSASRIDPGPFEVELLTARGNLKTWWGNLPEAAEDLSATIRWSRSGTPHRNLPNAYAALAESEYWLGRWEEGLTHAEVAVSLAEDADRLFDLPFVHAVASLHHAGRGNLTIAAEHIAAAGRVAELVQIPINRYYACTAVATLARARGDWDGVLESLSPLEQSAELVGPGHGQPIRWLMEAEALLHSGRAREAGRVLCELDEALNESPHDLARVDLCRLQGMLAGSLDHPAKARAAFSRGQELTSSARSSLTKAELELAYGQFLRKTGSRRRAGELLQTSRETFARLGARPHLERCDAELAACGIRTHPHGGGDDYGLTAREQVVAALVASGKSNREVAAELYLSTKAVEYHLGNIFTKVGIRSRHQLGPRLSGTLVGAAS